ncbi:MAG TPA: hypothetical protein VMJ10_36305 [Kofleriaceae bacterium]|nr:hypothetical protein [Kofleriaceae bacterium]
MSKLVRASCALLLLACGTTPDDRPETIDYIVNAILAPQCAQASCHTAVAKAHRLAFDTVEDAQAAFASPQNCGMMMCPMIVRGDSEQSDLYLVLTGARNAMPPVSPLPHADIYLIQSWIDDGAAGYTGP